MSIEDILRQHRHEDILTANKNKRDQLMESGFGAALGIGKTFLAVAQHSRNIGKMKPTDIFGAAVGGIFQFAKMAGALHARDNVRDPAGP